MKFLRQQVIWNTRFNGHCSLNANISEIDELIKLISRLPGLGPNQQKECFKIN